eukprot:360102-Chlamydomonas_euryale.AAC.4
MQSSEGQAARAAFGWVISPSSRCLRAQLPLLSDSGVAITVGLCMGGPCTGLGCGCWERGRDRWREAVDWRLAPTHLSGGGLLQMRRVV